MQCRRLVFVLFNVRMNWKSLLEIIKSPGIEQLIVTAVNCHYFSHTDMDNAIRKSGIDNGY